MPDFITPDQAIETCLKVGACGISLGLAKELQSERDEWKAHAMNAFEKIERLKFEKAFPLNMDREWARLEAAVLFVEAFRTYDSYCAQIHAEVSASDVDEIKRKSYAMMLRLAEQISPTKTAEEKT